MGADDKLKNQATETKGRAKEAAGAATGNDDLRSDGRKDQGKAKVKEAGRHAKEAGKNVKDTFTG